MGGWGYRCVGKIAFAVAVGGGRVIADLRVGGEECRCVGEIGFAAAVGVGRVIADLRGMSLCR